MFWQLQIPKNETVDYILEAFGKGLNNNSEASSSEAMIIFCIGKPIVHFIADW